MSATPSVISRGAGFLWRFREHFHSARAELFVRLMNPRPGASLLDVGGGAGAFATRICRLVPLKVTVAEVTSSARDHVRGLGYDFVQLAPFQRFPFDDGAFDIVFSNSVIEHVTLPGDRCRMTARVPQPEWLRESARNQRSFAEEVRRVGRGYFVQTPHRHFPIEAHVHLPFVQYLSHDASCRLVHVTERFWIKKTWGIVDWQLLTPVQMRRYFPDATIHVERFMGLPKSIIAYRP